MSRLGKLLELELPPSELPTVSQLYYPRFQNRAALASAHTVRALLKEVAQSALNGYAKELAIALNKLKLFDVLPNDKVSVFKNI